MELLAKDRARSGCHRNFELSICILRGSDSPTVGYNGASFGFLMHL